jgi:hypothetical protein
MYGLDQHGHVVVHSPEIAVEDSGDDPWVSGEEAGILLEAEAGAETVRV